MNNFIENLFPPIIFKIYCMGCAIGITKAQASMLAVTVCIFFAAIVLPMISSTCRWIRLEYYRFIREVIENNTSHDALFLVPLMSTIFLMILFGNLIGLIPGVFPSTCDFYLNLIMSTSVVLGTLFIAIYNQGWGAMNLFYPSGVPFFIKVILFCIEMPLFFVRIFSLAGRLLLNISAGHLVVACILGVAMQMKVLSLMYFFVMCIELMTSFLQPYIFLTLSSIYLNQAFEKH